MGTIVVVALIGAVAWLFLSGTYKTSFKEPETLRDTELEDAFIELKKKILVAKNDQLFEHLCHRIRAVLTQIMQRHQHFILDFDAKENDIRQIVRCRKDPRSHSIEYIVPHDLDLMSVQPDMLLYLCFFLYLGGQIKNIGNVESNPQFMLKILDHLIDERKYSAAYFFKGMVMKYGSRLTNISKPSEARTLLEFAQKKGVGAASIELAQLDKYAQLNGIKSVHPNL